MDVINPVSGGLVGGVLELDTWNGEGLAVVEGSVFSRLLSKPVKSRY